MQRVLAELESHLLCLGYNNILKLLSLGEKDSEMTFYSVLSAEGKPPSCTFREVEIAFPFDACSPLSTNGTDKYVIVAVLNLFETTHTVS